VVAIGDAATLVLWALLGLVRHTDGVTLAGLVRNAGPILIGWFAVAALFGTYARRRDALGFVLTWLVGISAGVVLRALFLHRSWDGAEWAFFGVTLAVTGVFLLVWRGLVTVVWRAAGRRRSPLPQSGA
jgi:hypothetical protein